MPFVSSFCLVAVARTTGTPLNQSGESRRPSLVAEIKGNACSLPIEHDVGCGFVIYGLYYIEVCSLYSHSAEGSCHKWVLDFIKCFFVSIDITM